MSYVRPVFFLIFRYHRFEIGPDVHQYVFGVSDKTYKTEINATPTYLALFNCKCSFNFYDIKKKVVKCVCQSNNITSITLCKEEVLRLQNILEYWEEFINSQCQAFDQKSLYQEQFMIVLPQSVTN